jgi:hypothetical protein
MGMGVVMADEKAVRVFIADALRHPLTAVSLAAIIFGGGSVFATQQLGFSSLSDDVRRQTAIIKQEALERDSAIKARVEKVETRVDKMSDDLGTIKGELRSIATDIRWLVTRQGVSPDPSSRGGPR